MSPLMKSKPVAVSVVAVALLFTTMVFRIVTRRNARVAATSTRVVSNQGGSAPNAVPGKPPQAWHSVAENAAYLDQYYDLDHRSHDDQDAQGVPVTRRKTPGTPPEVGRAAPAMPNAEVPAAPPVIPLSRSSSRLQGRTVAVAARGRDMADKPGVVSGGWDEPPAATRNGPEIAPIPPARSGPISAATPRPRPRRFNPYGSVLKCELVFPLDSVNEQMPLVGLVMEPVYNNGAVVIPAGTEVHGTARPDRLRNRLFSGEQWVLVFPREAARVNGRQLNVRGVALERAEPDVNGMTWRMTDGSYGLEGTLIRSLNGEEIKRFVATFLAAGSAGLQTKQGNAIGGDSVQSTPRNAVLQGAAADMQQVAADVAAEIAQHGVYIHIPAGHQFYLYPTQLIDPDAADISSDIATVK